METTTSEIQQLPAMQMIEVWKQLDQSIAIDKKVSWLQLCVVKSKTLETLQKEELRLQSLLLNYKTSFPDPINWATDKQKIVEALVGLQTALTNYAAGVRQLPEVRKAFTRYLDKINDQLMEVEKRASTWETFAQAKQFFLDIRAAKEANDSISGTKAQEAENFRAHIKNEYIRLEAEYKVALLSFIKETYAVALEEAKLGNKMDEVGVNKIMQSVWESINNEKVVPVGEKNKFDFKLHTREELLEIMKEPALQMPDFRKPALDEAAKQIRTVFSTYMQDIVQPDKAIEFVKAEEVKEVTQIQGDAARATHVNNLLSGANITSIVDNGGLKQSVKKTVILIKDEDPSWALKIASAFVGHWPVASAQLKIRKWGNLSISQMAAALDAAGVKVADVEYTDVIK